VYTPGASDVYNCEPGTAAQKFLTSLAGPPGYNFGKFGAEDYGSSLPIKLAPNSKYTRELFPVDVAIVLPLTVSSVTTIGR
jgi:hypothetical protein